MLQPALHITILGRSISRFHFFGVMGYILGLCTGLWLAHELHLQAWVVGMMSGIGALVFFGLAFLSKALLGRENIVYYHHEISVVVCCALALYALRLPVLPYLDLCIIGIGIFLVCGRLGCYSVGCCHGRPHRHGISYGAKHVEAGFTWYYQDVRLLPVPLIESGTMLLVVSTAIVLLLKGVSSGFVLLAYTMVYGCLRYTLEFLRGDAERPYWMGVSEAQWTSLILIGVTLALSFTHVLPFYGVHLAVFFLVLALSLFMAFYYHHKESFRLSAPGQVRRLAEALYSMNHQNRTRIYTGDAISLSCGRQQLDDMDIRHYTVSSPKKIPLKKKTLHQLGKQLACLDKLSGEPDIIDRNNGIYHLVYSRKNAAP